MQVTYDEYDKMSEVFEKIKASKKLQPFWPNPDQIRHFYNNPEKFARYACYLYDMNPAPQDEAEKESKKRLQAFVNKTIELVEEPINTLF